MQTSKEEILPESVLTSCPPLRKRSHYLHTKEQETSKKALAF